jgi:hypothetical protein
MTAFGALLEKGERARVISGLMGVSPGNEILVKALPLRRSGQPQ